MDDRCALHDTAAVVPARGIDWLPPKLVERMERRRGRLHAFDTLEARRTALVVIDLTVLVASDAENAAAVIDTINGSPPRCETMAASSCGCCRAQPPMIG